MSLKRVFLEHQQMVEEANLPEMSPEAWQPPSSKVSYHDAAIQQTTDTNGGVVCLKIAYLISSTERGWSTFSGAGKKGWSQYVMEQETAASF